MHAADLLLTALCAGAVLTTARLIAASLAPSGWIEYALLGYVVAWTEIVAILLLLSPFEQVRRLPFVVGLTAVLAGAIALWRSRGRPAPPAVSPLFVAARRALTDPPVLLLALVVGAGWIYTVALGLLTRPLEWDALAYHLPRAALWLQDHAVGYIQPTVEPRLNGNLPGAEIGLLATMLSSGSDRFVAVPQLLALGALVLAVAGVARRIGLTQAQAMVGALLFASLPVVAVQAPTPYNDLIVASFLAVAAFALLGRTRADLVLLVLSLALAVLTKFTTIFALPILAAVALTQRGRRLRLVMAGAVGCGLGAVWFIVNIVETGHADGGLQDATAQNQPISLATIAPTVRRHLYSLVDFSGTRGINAGALFLGVAALAALTGIVASLRWKTRRGAATGLLAAAVIVFPLMLVMVARAFLHVWVKGWLVLGRADIARQDASWQVQTSSDAALSWFGPLAAALLLIVATLVIVDVRRGHLAPVAAVLVGAPFAFLAVFAVFVPWDPWRGRFVIFAVALAAATWGVITVHRGVLWGAALITAVSLPLALAGMYTKPAGAPFLEGTDGRAPSVWRVDERALLAYLDQSDAFVGALEALDLTGSVRVAAALRENDFLYSLFDHHQRRVVLIVPTNGRVPDGVDALVVAPGLHPLVCGRWARDYARRGWIVYHREAGDGSCRRVG